MSNEYEIFKRDIKNYDFSFEKCDNKIIPIIKIKHNDIEIEIDKHDLDMISGMFKYWNIWWERNKNGTH